MPSLLIATLVVKLVIDGVVNPQSAVHVILNTLGTLLALVEAIR